MLCFEKKVFYAIENWVKGLQIAYGFGELVCSFALWVRGFKNHVTWKDFVCKQLEKTVRGTYYFSKVPHLAHFLFELLGRDYRALSTKNGLPLCAIKHVQYPISIPIYYTYVIDLTFIQIPLHNLCIAYVHSIIVYWLLVNMYCVSHIYF